MWNKSSAISKARSGKRPKVASFIEPQSHYGVSMQRKLKTKPPEVVSLGVYPTQQQQQGEKEKPLYDDDTFSNYIQCTKYKIKSKSNTGCDEKQRYPAPTNIVANGTNVNNNKENERDPFSDNYIQNAKKKLRTRTVSRKK